MHFLFITQSPDIAKFVTDRGVDRLFIDLEIIGKDERQGHLNTVISRHSFEDLKAVRAAAPSADILVRLNPVYENTLREVDTAIELGADILMLPMFRTVHEVETFCAAVNGRCRVCLLVETIGAMKNLRESVRVPGVTEVHIGLNDLHLELGSTFMFEPLADGLVDEMAEVLREEKKPFGIGGVARAGEGLLSAELILGEHVRLGSTAAILSRTFHRQAATVSEIEKEMDFAQELVKLRETYGRLSKASPLELKANQQEVKQRVSQIAATIKAKQQH